MRYDYERFITWLYISRVVKFTVCKWVKSDWWFSSEASNSRRASASANANLSITIAGTVVQKQQDIGRYCQPYSLSEKLNLESTI
jgi:hypothetical protein